MKPLDRCRWLMVNLWRWGRATARGTSYLMRLWRPRRHNLSRTTPRTGWWWGWRACRSAGWSTRCFASAWSSETVEGRHLQGDRALFSSGGTGGTFRTLFGLPWQWLTNCFRRHGNRQNTLHSSCETKLLPPSKRQKTEQNLRRDTFSSSSDNTDFTSA